MSYSRNPKLIYIIMATSCNNFQPGSKLKSSFCCLDPWPFHESRHLAAQFLNVVEEKSLPAPIRLVWLWGTYCFLKKIWPCSGFFTVGHRSPLSCLTLGLNAPGSLSTKDIAGQSRGPCPSVLMDPGTLIPLASCFFIFVTEKWPLSYVCVTCSGVPLVVTDVIMLYRLHLWAGPWGNMM